MTLDSFVRRLRREDSGQTAVLAALMLPVLIGFVGLALDVGYAFDYRAQMQTAADSAAVAGAYAVKANALISSTALANVARLDATANGFTNGSNGITISVCRPAVDFTCPTTYTYTAGSGAVKVTISQPKATFFTKILNFTSLTIGTSAVAATTAGNSNASIVILDTNCKNQALNATGSSDLTIGGSIYVNSCGDAAANVTGGGTISATDGIFIACNSSPSPTCGDYNATGGSTFTPTPSTGNPQIPDPLAGLPEPTPTGPVYNSFVKITSNGTLYPGVYNAGLEVSGGTVTFMPGIYFINGNKLNFKGNSTNVLGTGVMFYGYNGAQFTTSGGPTITMSAPTSGTYKGIWYFQERSNVKDASLTGGSTINITGVIYISNPSTRLVFTGSSGSGSAAQYTIFVVWNLIITGGGTFNTDYSALGGSPLNVGGGIALAE